MINNFQEYLIDGALKQQIEVWLLADPTLNATKLATKINELFPGKFKDKQSASIQSFVRHWRLAHPEHNASYSSRFKPDKKPTKPHKRFEKEE